METAFIYRNREAERFYDASTGEMRGGADKVIAYANGILCAIDRESKITFPVSRWKLAQIGFGCVLTAVRGKGAAIRSVEPVPLATPPPAALSEHPAEVTESPEERWERLLQEIQDLSR